jgi:tol-pal system protein YbgF
MKKLVLAAMLGLMATSAPAGAFSLPKLFQGNQSSVQQPSAAPQEAPVILAQSNDAVRNQQLQEQIRQLNGRIEEMSYQLLQMQEQLRKTQEDNEFRFQDLEKKKRSDLGDAAGQPAVASSRPSTGSDSAPAQPATPSDDVARIIGQPGMDAGPSHDGAHNGAQGGPTTAPPPTTLGSMDFDQNGNPRGATRNSANNSAGLPGVDVGSPVQGRTPPAPSRPDPQQTASLGSETDTYQTAYNHVLSGDYSLAEREFSGFIQSYPKSNRIADANFWLGEAQYSQQKYNEAAKTFLNAHQTYGKSAKAPEMLLKLGMSLAALDNNETACATLKEVPRRYPSASRAVLTKVSSEQKRLSCG